MGFLDRLPRTIKTEMNNSLNNSEKILNKQIKEMEATIIELRKSIARVSAAKKRNEEGYNYSISEIARWKQRVELALSEGNENLAREALLRKQYFRKNAEKLKTKINLDNSAAIIIDLQQKLTALEMKVVESSKAFTDRHFAQI